MARPIVLVLLVASVLLGGCAGNGDGPAGEGDGDAAPPAGDHGAAGEPLNVTLTHDHTRAPRTEEVVVPNGTRSLHVTIRFTAPADAPTCEGGTARVTLRDPDGKDIASASAGTSVVGSCGSLDEPDLPAVAGAWRVEFSGTGAVTATVTIRGDAAHE